MSPGSYNHCPACGVALADLNRPLCSGCTTRVPVELLRHERIAKQALTGTAILYGAAKDALIRAAKAVLPADQP
ncbi:MAG: hypothetical protein GC168_20465 [Candidatus Hydrogenedens sp.]|nr:hypothetical protein [Candidatus Hydrogenedens sp.]